MTCAALQSREVNGTRGPRVLGDGAGEDCGVKAQREGTGNGTWLPGQSWGQAYTQTEDNRAEKVELGFVSRFISLGERKWKVLL